MLNKYPLWKNLLVLTAVILGVIFSLPNIYPPDFAVQVSSENNGESVTTEALDAAVAAVEEAGFDYFAPMITPAGNIIIRFKTDTEQRQAKAIIQRAMFDAPGEYVVALNAAASTPQWLKDLRAEPMKYGLDLRGGVHFLMEVDTESVVTNRIDSLETDVKRKLREQKIRYKSVQSPRRGVLHVSFRDEDVRSAARSELETQYREFTFSNGDDELPYLALTITQNAIDEMEDFAISQNLQTIRNRVNELGVAEPLVQRLGRNRIVVDLPGVQDTAEAKRILGKVATLEFRFEAKPDAPRSTTMKFDYEGREASLEKNIILRGDRVVDAQVGFDPDSGLPQVNITLDSEGGNLMHRSTRNNIGRRMGTVFIETKTRDSYEMVDGVEVRLSEPYVVKRRRSARAITTIKSRRTRSRYVYCRRANRWRQHGSRER
jgi:preprotein translocase subunit SecD